MRAMRLERAGAPLSAVEVAAPEAGPGQLVIAVSACGVCRTDLHLVDGELPDPKLPVTPGHEIVGRVVARGAGAEGFSIGERVGVPWLGWTCGECEFCRRGEENLCARARFHGYTLDGGYAERVAADARYCFRIPERYGDAEAAPLLCAGLIGYRAYAMAGAAERIGLYGFGAAAHLIAQVARADRRRLFAFTRAGDAAAQELARSLGAEWAGGSEEAPPEPLDAAILFAPVGALVPRALAAVRPGGQVICAGIHMSDVPSFPYRLLWGERVVRSVANLTRADGEALLARAATVAIESRIASRPLAEANRALDELRAGKVTGALVLLI